MRESDPELTTVHLRQINQHMRRDGGTGAGSEQEGDFGEQGVGGDSFGELDAEAFGPVVGKGDAVGEGRGACVLLGELDLADDGIEGAAADVEDDDVAGPDIASGGIDRGITAAQGGGPVGREAENGLSGVFRSPRSCARGAG